MSGKYSSTASKAPSKAAATTTARTPGRFAASTRPARNVAR
jgi:hypothetical protein